MILALFSKISLALAAPVSGFAAASAPAETVVVVVRHAEKRLDGSRDPRLSELGERRLQALVSRLQPLKVSAVYATPFQRTRQTGQAVADAQGVELIVREFTSGNVDEDAQVFRDEILREHRGEVVLVVGHSNTVPPLVEALSGLEAEPMPESEYDRLSTVRIAADGSAALEVDRY
jgi:broad specificity phosphatase PhoE